MLYLNVVSNGHLQKMCFKTVKQRMWRRTSSIAISYVQQDMTEFYIQLLPSHKSLVVSVFVDGVNLDMEVAGVKSHL